MTHQEEIRNKVRNLLKAIDSLYSLHGSDNGGVFIDTTFMQELYHNSQFLCDVTELNK